MSLTTSQWIFLIISFALSCCLILKAWKSSDPFLFKLLLSLAGLIPLIGPILLLWNLTWPSKWPEGMQAKSRNQVNHYSYPKAIDSELQKKR
jgi:hypothetical protein